MKLAEALLRRKELQGKVDRIKALREQDLFETRVTRKQVHEGIDDVIAAIPKLELNQVTTEYDHYAKILRMIDSSIQQANWNTDIEVNPIVGKDFVEKK
jgi:hypothetical protein